MASLPELVPLPTLSKHHKLFFKFNSKTCSSVKSQGYNGAKDSLPPLADSTTAKLSVNLSLVTRWPFHLQSLRLQGTPELLDESQLYLATELVCILCQMQIQTPNVILTMIHTGERASL